MGLIQLQWGLYYIPERMAYVRKRTSSIGDELSYSSVDRRRFETQWLLLWEKYVRFQID